MILVHHLRIGRSVFTVWLLEELGLDYELKIYERDRNFRAQADLKEAHPLGKSPVIEDGGLKLAESGAIATYLVDTYDKDGLLAPPRSDVAARAQWTQWLHYTEGSAFAPLLMKLLLRGEQEPHPLLIGAFANGEVALQLGYIQDFLGDKTFLLGEQLQAPDFGMTYILQLANRLGELQPHPLLNAYLERNLTRPAFKRAMERTGG
ncbi:glutathione S-transferase family protein [Hoeflea sp. TYP-13]|uniref:glutathione S-transferase family protein n=1 Tax=Hoeflea sp. TYP-13 TaxID=3230023 RepID=UPI0034C6916E